MLQVLPKPCHQHQPFQSVARSHRGVLVSWCGFNPLVAQRWRIHLQCGRPGFDPWVGKIPWRWKRQPTPVFLPGKSHGHRSLAGYSPWGHKSITHDGASKQQWLVTPSIFSRVYQLFSAFLGEVICNTLPTIFKLAWLSFYYWAVRVLYMFCLQILFLMVSFSYFQEPVILSFLWAVLFLSSLRCWSITLLIHFKNYTSKVSLSCCFPNCLHFAPEVFDWL